MATSRDTLRELMVQIQDKSASVSAVASDPKINQVDALFAPVNARDLVKNAIEAALLDVETTIAAIRNLIR